MSPHQTRKWKIHLQTDGGIKIKRLAEGTYIGIHTYVVKLVSIPSETPEERQLPRFQVHRRNFERQAVNEFPSTITQGGRKFLGAAAQSRWKRRRKRLFHFKRFQLFAAPS